MKFLSVTWPRNPLLYVVLLLISNIPCRGSVSLAILGYPYYVSLIVFRNVFRYADSFDSRSSVLYVAQSYFLEIIFERPYIAHRSNAGVSTICCLLASNDLCNSIIGKCFITRVGSRTARSLLWNFVPPLRGFSVF